MRVHVYACTVNLTKQQPQVQTHDQHVQQCEVIKFLSVVPCSVLYVIYAWFKIFLDHGT